MLAYFISSVFFSEGRRFQLLVVLGLTFFDSENSKVSSEVRVILRLNSKLIECINGVFFSKICEESVAIEDNNFR